ncbi:MAG TPA: glycerol kinase, partial [Planctomycetes bacterium]|nr:glycerol kinase [Planctomycetota bacterium]
ERCAELRGQGHEPLVRERTGLVLDPYFSGTKIEWMLGEVPMLRARAERGEVVFATVDTLVAQHLVGGEHWCTEPTNASRTMLFDIERRTWDAELCALFGVDVSWLPEVRASAGEFGASEAGRTGGRSIPIRGMVGDQQSALFGQACFAPGSLKVTFGTGTFLLLNTGGKRSRSSGGLLTTLALAADGTVSFALEGSVFTSGAVVQWLRDGLGIIESAAEVESLARSVDDTGGVFLVPAFAGLGAPHWDPDARAAILGMTRGTNRAHIARAALEGIAFQNAELVEVLRADTGLVLERLLADGGAASNDLLLELQADLAGLTILRPDSVEATARGAALLAGLSSGLVPDVHTPAALAETPDTFEPELPEDDRLQRLAAWRDAVSRISSR